MITARPEMISSGWMLIGRQVRTSFGTRSSSWRRVKENRVLPSKYLSMGKGVTRETALVALPSQTCERLGNFEDRLGSGLQDFADPRQNLLDRSQSADAFVTAGEIPLGGADEVAAVGR